MITARLREAIAIDKKWIEDNASYFDGVAERTSRLALLQHLLDALENLDNEGSL